ncbi:MAG: helix-turn-helix domain-containing protein, partial [Candidatus Beckwithbacteria bacterium]|nr:helix-turn-helix domain-containing protein [Candidatus Beckwithbacteria bacterium]
MFSIKDAAQALGIHPKTIRRWEKSGKFIPQRTPGNQRRFSPDDILKLKKLQLAPNPIPGVKPACAGRDVHTPGVNLWTKYTHFLSLTALIIVLFLAGYLFYQNSSKIASPTIQQLDLNKQDVQIAMPQVANFLNGQITIGSDTGTLSFLDQKGNLYLKNSALVEGVIQTTALQFAPSAKPDNQLGRQYVDKTTGNLMYFDGLDWVTLNQAASQSANLNSSLATNSALPLKILGSADQAIMTIDENSAYPVLFSQPTKVLANFYANKFIDSDSSSYFLDPSASVISLSVAGNATISSNLTFSAYGESITNSVDNYLVFSGGLGIGGITSYGFSPDFKVKAKNAQVDDELVISNLKLTTNKIEALNNDGIKLYDNAGYGLYIKDGGNVTINGVDLLVPDYVFDTNYQLLSPIDLEEFTKIHHHLPNVASA